jgi:cytochrome c oxidase subunit II
VIHSFWIPALTGKTDLVPGQTNVTWMEASKPGIYRGQCSEYCGAQHAHMGLLVVADPPDAFQAWRAAQQSAAATPLSEEALHGAALFIGRCGVCHSVRGTPAGGILGPDLSHLMQRRTIAAGTLPNRIGDLGGWIADPQGIKPGSSMPRPDLSSGELQEVLAYLQTLN